jgi:hypothetical protein
MSQNKAENIAMQQWVMPIILATQEAEIVRTAVLGQLGQKVQETLSQPIKAGHSS